MVALCVVELAYHSISIWLFSSTFQAVTSPWMTFTLAISHFV